MKKVLLITLAGLLALSSCVKDRTCTCTTTDASGVKIITSRTGIKGTKKASLDPCMYSRVEITSSEDIDNSGYTDCELD